MECSDSYRFNSNSFFLLRVALSGVEGAHMLKDVALVVVGFYFGTQKRTTEVINGENKTITSEEHINERTIEENKNIS